jgi:hypothetical protein
MNENIKVEDIFCIKIVMGFDKLKVSQELA